MLRDVYWRQYPVDLLSDDKMACVEAELPEDLKYAPYMFYCAALKLCDDNGVFDLDDGVIMARLMRVDDPAIVFNIANLMRKRKIIYRLFDDAMLCGLVDWTYSDKKPRTIDERRKAVAEAIKQKQSNASSSRDFMTVPQKQQAAPFTAPKAAAELTAPEVFPIPDYITKCKICEAYNAETKCCTDNRPNACKEHLAKVQEAVAAAPRRDFLCTENDKKAENVVISKMDDKNAKNVVTLQDNTIQDSTVHNTGQKDRQTNTHTLQQSPGYAQPEGAPPEDCADTNAVGIKIQNQNTENSNINTSEEVSGGEDISTLAEMAWNETQGSDEEKDTGPLVAYLNDFFVKNCYGYKQNQSAGAIKKLVSEILQLSDDVNPPETVASVLCSEFKKLCEGQREQYWKGTPLLPANMIKPRILAEIVQYAGKILATAQNTEKFVQAAQKAQEESEAEKDLVYDAMREEYVKYNINPDDPNASRLLIIAKGREAKAAREAEDEEFEIF